MIVEGYPKYEINQLGEVKNIKTGRKLKWRHTLKGYCYVTLYDENLVPKNLFVHRLVALHFLPNPNNYPVVNHKDENKDNNIVDNLEWCTIEYNTNYGTRNERSSTAILQLDKQDNVIKKWNSVKEAANTLGIDPTNISAVINKRNNRVTAGGFKWRFA